MSYHWLKASSRLSCNCQYNSNPIVLVNSPCCRLCDNLYYVWICFGPICNDSISFSEWPCHSTYESIIYIDGRAVAGLAWLLQFVKNPSCDGFVSSKKDIFSGHKCWCVASLLLLQCMVIVTIMSTSLVRWEKDEYASSAGTKNEPRLEALRNIFRFNAGCTV